MAQFFGADSVQSFANGLLKSTSEQRQRMLRQYYSQQNPDLEDLVKQVFPEPPSAAAKSRMVASPPPSSSSSSTTLPSGKNPTLKFTHTEHAPKRHISLTSEGTEEKSRAKKCRTLCPKTPSRNSDQTEMSPPALSGGSKTVVLTRTFRDPHVEPHERPGPQPDPKRNTADTCTERNPQVPPEVPRHVPPKVPPEVLPHVPQVPSRDDQSVNTHSSKSLLTDLLGDTSILDQLFKPKPKPQCSDRPSPSSSNPAGPHMERKAKARSKDLWDILSEGNEESINKLTDLTQIEKICSSTVKKDIKSNDSPLWRKNEKFLWKKQD